MEQVILNDIALKYDRKKGRFSLSINELQVNQNVCEFLLTIGFLIGKDVEALLMSTDSANDSVRIPLTGAGKTVTLDLPQFIRFREAYSRQLFLLRLEDMLLHKGVCLPK